MCSVIRVDFIEEPRACQEDSVVAGALYEDSPLLELSRSQPALASPPHQTEGLPPCEHVPGLLVHQHHLLLGGDDLRLGELVESSASLEYEGVALDKLLDAAPGRDLKHLEPGGVDRHQTISPGNTVANITSSTCRLAALQSVKQTVNLPVHPVPGPQLGLVVVQAAPALLPEADGQHEADDGAELVQPQVKSLRQPRQLSVELSGLGPALDSSS